MPFPYKWVLVFGATSGIGRALAERFIQEGAFVIGTGRRKERLDDFVSKHGKDKAAGVPFDINDLSSHADFVQKLTSTYPDLDLFFLNAGFQRGHRWDQPESIDVKLNADEMHTNYVAQLSLTKEVVKFALAKPDVNRTLLYTTSNLAIVPLVRCPNYCASKAALHAHILCLRAQLEGKNVKVLELLPPAVQTELHDQPDIKNGRSFGMPLDKFTEQAYAGIAEEKETILVGSEGFGNVQEVEMQRQKLFWDLTARVKGHM